MSTIFFTGFPGFLGAELLPRLLRRSPDVRVRCLVQSKFAELARKRASGIGGGTRIEIVEGDITQPITARSDDVVEIYHLAAIYDLAVRRDLAMRVNVDGTRNVLDFAARCPSLQRFQYVSTCYVSGQYRGVFRETDLEKGQAFGNYYEETKYLAEVEVQKRMHAGLPATIYRPAITVGDSVTGETQKFDGPYFVIQWILRQPHLSVLPMVPGSKRYHLNVVPRDFVIEAFDRLSAMPQSLGKVYQLADPDPMTIEESVNAIAGATGHSLVRIPLPLAVAKGAVRYVPGVYRLMRIPAEAIDYFVHPTEYDTTNTRHDLGSMRIPHLRDYLPRLVDFARAHPEIGSAAMA
ncbi:MAG TPA: SDR family oxidoreductase [Thermoanaerobaculia bacterium]|nr:SDR family oxidoreductase [Thermoanaerobaculia bacterium]